MKPLTKIFLLAALAATPQTLFAQLSADQRAFDFQNLAALYAKRYAPYEWKRHAFGFDLFNIKPWMDRVRAAKDDLEFFEIEAEYVANLNDTHAGFTMPSSLGLAISNLSNAATTVTLELNRLDGSSTGLTGTVLVPANGHVSQFLNQIPGFASLSLPFQGVLRISSPSPISVVGLRGRYNERSDFLIATIPSANEAAAPPSAELFFPHFVEAGGYTTQFILFGRSIERQLSGTLRFVSQSGEPLNLTLR